MNWNLYSNISFFIRSYLFIRSVRCRSISSRRLICINSACSSSSWLPICLKCVFFFLLFFFSIPEQLLIKHSSLINQTELKWIVTMGILETLATVLVLDRPPSSQTSFKRFETSNTPTNIEYIRISIGCRSILSRSCRSILSRSLICIISASSSSWLLSWSTFF